MKKLIIAGGRDFNDINLMADEVNKLISKGLIDHSVELICGMAVGADKTGYSLFKHWGFKYHKYPANWQDMSEPCVRKYNKFGGLYNALAGMKRNHQMGDDADLLLAFWCGSSGTKDMINYMTKLGKPVYIYYYGKWAHKKSEVRNETSTRLNR